MHTISGTMAPTRVAEILRQHQCHDLTDELDHNSIKVASCGGGWGDVFQGRLNNGTVVAVKCTHVYTLTTDFPRVLKQSAKELAIWAKCNHPNIMKLIGFADHKGRFAMISLWMEGGDARAYIESNPKADRLNMCYQIANGLCYFHDHHMAHGDLKAQNVMVSQDGSQIKLTDLGSATIKNHSISLSSMTADLRSMFWAPPEIAFGTSPNDKSDIYSLGMTILEIITGEFPFAGWSEKALLNRLVLAGDPDLEGVIAPIPKRPECCIPVNDNCEKIWNLMVACWAQVPTERPDAKMIRDGVYSACLDRNASEMKVWDHGGRVSYPVCKYVDPVNA